MSEPLVVRGRYSGHAFIPDGPLPDAEGPAELIITPQAPLVARSAFESFGKAPRLRSAEDIAAQLREERDAWGEP
jgi:hypothetical protein